MSDPTSSDQALINAMILFQLDVIGKLLNVIVNLCPNLTLRLRNHVKPIAASSNLTVSQGEADLQEKLPNLQTMRHDIFIQEQVENHLKEL